MHTVTVSMRLSKEEVAALELLGRQLGLERSALLKQALRRGCAQIRFENAARAYRRREITLSRAAELAGLGLREMLLRLPDASLELSYGLRDLAEDLKK